MGSQVSVCGPAAIAHSHSTAIRFPLSRSPAHASCPFTACHCFFFLFTISISLSLSLSIVRPCSLLRMTPIFTIVLLQPRQSVLSSPSMSSAQFLPSPHRAASPLETRFLFLPSSPPPLPPNPIPNKSHISLLLLPVVCASVSWTKTSPPSLPP